jgi:hypothetical protein
MEMFHFRLDGDFGLSDGDAGIPCQYKLVSNLFLLARMSPIRTGSRPSMRTTAGLFLNKREYRIQMLNGEKSIETHLFEKTKLDGPSPYTNVIF